ncbi:N-terminal C2 in EEIG1 and EHBP1 proteins-domain-containing protein [Truncatella angustata]|uniref:N-terminal C2 in EEIG1 and EHBP1 proteins-domain-containing protein n=1 Tax=Truncatella angustata TaxID=152316 RepID=A0A9P8UGW2_9PEZI|nr:N-terminal C2 in EEIG1 and EHBP1 proteins-domain-containing protein [Truncatella angustata]KAH6651883.1 N-terminal C2 in EEIG1 and EHBP1 proteins-domain-containing protein [Truncatella angustata]
MASLINKARKPKFDLHLTIYDLNNVPLVSGTSQIKWHLPHSMHGEHRGRTDKCPIDSINHRVTYDYSKIVPVRISIDKNNSLTDCPIEFEVVQEFSSSGGRDEKINMGVVRLNLSEYVEESENFPRKSLGSRMGGSLEHARKDILGPALQGKRRLSSASASGTLNSAALGVENGIAEEQEAADEGIIRRYLMQESKINSTLKLGILMIQIDGDRNYVAPALKTAPMFGGIAGIMAEGVEPVDDAAGSGAAPNVTSQNKSREASELQDMYRRALAASWSCQAGELPADECIEDIFSGGDGWKDPNNSRRKKKNNDNDRHQSRGRRAEDLGSTTSSGSEEAHGGTLKPSDVHRMRDKLFHRRQHSASSERSLATVKEGRGHSSSRQRPQRQHTRDDPFADESSRVRSESLASLAPTMGSLGSGSGSGSAEHGYAAGRRGGHKEVSEFDVRDDLVSWGLPGTVV